MYGGSDSPQGAGDGGHHQGGPPVDPQAAPPVDNQGGPQGASSEEAPERSVWTPDGATEPADPPADAGTAGSPSGAAMQKAGVSVLTEGGGRQAQADNQRNGSAEEKGDRVSYFVGGLHPEITRGELQEYLSGFVPVEEIDIKMDVSTGRNRGYAFISVRPPFNADAFLNTKHILRDKQVDIRELGSKPAPERQAERPPERRMSSSSANRHKIFIGGITSSVTEETLQHHFEQFGSIEKATIIRDGSGKSRGFGFVQFTSVDSVALAVGASPHQLDSENKVDAQPAQDRGARRLPAGRYSTSPYYEQGYYGYGYGGAAAGPYGYHAAAAAAYSPMYAPNPYGAYAGYGGYYGGTAYGDAYGTAEGGYGAIRRG
ncbi:RNA binding motif-containing protein [Cyclospora cayetanensis]|nr:RNA binding motif-containing protein [Cyclospora cayetanensis]